MDKLTAIKIKYDDGTYSDEIPVSVLAENVEWDDTHTLMDVLGSVDVDITGTIQDQISQLFNEKINYTQLNNYVASQLNTDVTTWLNTNVNPVGSTVIVDKSLSIEDAAADAKKTGDEIGELKEEINNLADFAIPVDSGISVGTLTTGGYIKPTNGEQGALAYGCRSGYIDIFLGGSTSKPLPLEFVASFDLSVYKYTIYGYTSHSVSSASESFTNSTWTTNKRTYIQPASGTVCIRVSVIRIDLQGTITTEQAADIASKIKLMRVTDATLAKDGIPADARATGDAINALKSRIYPGTKKFAFFGDSIMWGRDGNGSASTQVTKTIPDVVAEKLGIVATNYGVGGMGWVEDPGQTGINAYEKIADTDLSGFDYAVLAFGVNDGQKPIGEWDSTDETTCAGQINKCIGYLQTEYPELLIIVISPWNGRNIGAAPDYWYGDVTVVGTRYSRQELRNVEARICQNQWIPFIDVYDSPINTASILTALPDGVHPSADYYIKIGEWLAAKIGGLLK